MAGDVIDGFDANKAGCGIDNESKEKRWARAGLKVTVTSPLQLQDENNGHSQTVNGRKVVSGGWRRGGAGSIG